MSWRFVPDKITKKAKPFTPNEKDIKAVNDILTWVNNQKKESIKNNKLFAKLYIFYLDEHIKRFETTIFDDIPQKALSRLLSMSLNSFYTSFHNNLHQNKRNKFLEFTTKDLEVITDNEIETIFKEDYSIDYVAKELQEMITEAKNRFSEYD